MYFYLTTPQALTRLWLAFSSRKNLSYKIGARGSWIGDPGPCSYYTISANQGENILYYLPMLFLSGKERLVLLAIGAPSYYTIDYN